MSDNDPTLTGPHAPPAPGQDAGRAPEPETLPPDRPSPTATFDPNRTTGLDATGAGDADGPVPGYELLGELGRGGMGVVYRARDTRLNRPSP